MTIEQMYYTSCVQGLGSSPGFQFNAVSEGLDLAVLPEVQGFIGYEPPLSAPAQPTDAELERFPIALSYATLPQGAAILGQTRYVGTDYSGRYGNFFAHVLYMRDPSHDLGSLYPIDLWRSRAWVNGEAASPALPAIAGPLSASSIPTEELVAFLDSDSRRRQQLEAFLAAVRENLGADGRRQIVLVEASSDDIARWIAIASYSLPPPLARALTFTTYTRRPYYDKQRIVGTTADAEFHYSVNELNDQYVVFDFAGDRFSPKQEDDWAKLAAGLWSDGSVELLGDCHEFVADSGMYLTEGELAGVLAAFTAAKGHQLSERLVSVALSWAKQNSQFRNDAFWYALGRSLERSLDDMSFELLSQLAQEWQRRRDQAMAAPFVGAYLRRAVEHLATGGPSEGLWAPRAGAAQLELRSRDVLEVLSRPETGLVACQRILAWLDRCDIHLNDETLARLGEMRVGPEVLAGRESPTELVTLVQSRSGEAIGQGVLTSLEAGVGASPADFAQVVRLTRGPLGPWLSSLEHGLSRPLRLAIAVGRPQSAEGDRIAVLDVLLGYLEKKLGARSPADSAEAGADLRWACELIWATSGFSATEAIGILRVVPDLTLVSSGLLPALVDIVLDAPVITKRIVELAERLHEIAAQANVGREKVAVLGAVADFVRLPGPGTLPSREVLVDATAIAEAAAAADRPVAGSVLQAISEWAIGLPPADHATALKALLGEASGPFFEAYRGTAGQLPDRDDSGWARVVAERFCAWLALGETNPKVANALLRDVLAPTLRSARRRDRAEVERRVMALGQDAWSAWEQWAGTSRWRLR